MRQTWILGIIFVLFVIGHYNHVLFIGMHDIVALVWQEKAFLSTIFLRFKAIWSNKTNLDSYNNLYVFVIGHYNHVLLISIHEIGTLVWQEIPSFSL